MILTLLREVINCYSFQEELFPVYDPGNLQVVPNQFQ